MIDFLNDVREGNYIFLRKYNSISISKIQNRGVLCILLLVYYLSLNLFILGLWYKLTGIVYYNKHIKGILFFSSYALIYYLINRKISTNYNMNIYSQDERNRKMKSFIYFSTGAFVLLIFVILINIFVFGF